MLTTQELAEWVMMRAHRCHICIEGMSRPFHSITCEDIRIISEIMEGSYEAKWKVLKDLGKMVK
jgi:hypothetical protein